MSADPTPGSTLARRALLTGAAGSAAALVVALTRPARSAAAVGDPLIAGQANVAGGATTSLSNTSNSNHTLVVTQNGRSTAIRGDANMGTGGRFKTGGRHKFGLIATNTAGSSGDGAALLATGDWAIAIRAESAHNTAIEATAYQDAIRATSEQGAGVVGESMIFTGVKGSSDSATGVVGSSNSSYGVYAESGTGTALYANSVSGYAGHFAGAARVETFVDFDEVAEPAGPPANRGRLFVQDSGGKSQLCIRFGSGATQVIATEP